MTIPNSRVYQSAGIVSAGAIGSETGSTWTGELTFYEFLDFLEGQEDRECVPVFGTTICSEQAPTEANPAVKLSARAGAICQSADDWNKIKTKLEEACRMLGKRCSYGAEGFQLK